MTTPADRLLGWLHDVRYFENRDLTAVRNSLRAIAREARQQGIEQGERQERERIRAALEDLRVPDGAGWRWSLTRKQIDAFLDAPESQP